MLLPEPPEPITRYSDKKKCPATTVIIMKNTDLIIYRESTALVKPLQNRFNPRAKRGVQHPAGSSTMTS